MTILQLVSEFDKFKYETGLFFKCRQMHDELQQVIDFLKGRIFDTFVEIGGAEGSSLWVYSNLLCKENANIYSIEKKVMPQLVHTVKQLRKINRKVEIIDKPSVEASFLVPDKIDLLHIDGSHTYDDVKRDYIMYSSKVVKGGVIIIHDTLSTHEGPPLLRKELEGTDINMTSFEGKFKGAGVSIIIK